MHSLEPHKRFSKNLLFWITLFTKFNAHNLSTKGVTDKEVYAKLLLRLDKDIDSIDDIHHIIKEFAKIGAVGVKGYVYPILKLHAFLLTLSPSSMRDINTEMMLSFLTTETIDKSDSTKINYRNSVGNFFRYISENNENVKGSNVGYIYKLNISRWQGLTGKSGKKLPVYLNEEEIYLFLKGVDEYEYSSERFKAFYGLFIRILLYSGIRVSECATLKQKNINLNKGVYSFLIDGKGNKQRMVYVSAFLIEEALEAWKKQSNCAKELLFCSSLKEDGKVNTSSVSIQIAKILAFVGISKGKSGAHLLRHSFATFVYGKTKDQKLLQEQLGHATSDTTAIYTHIAEEEKKKISQLF